MAGWRTKRGRELPRVRSQGQQPRVPGCDGAGTAGRSHSVSKVRGGSREELPSVRGQWLPEGDTPRPRSGWRPGGDSPRPRSGAAGRSHPEPEARAGGWEEQPEEWCLSRHRGPRGAIPCGRSGTVAARRYPSSKVRSSSCVFWSSREEISHVQGKRNPSKMVGVMREHQRADTLKLKSQKTTQSDHRDHNFV